MAVQRQRISEGRCESEQQTIRSNQSEDEARCAKIVSQPQVVARLLLFLISVLLWPPAESADHLSHPIERNMKSLEDFLAGLETISVNEKHAAQFTCDSDTISPNISTLIWVRLRKNDTSGQYDTRPISLGERLVTPDRRFSVANVGHSSASSVLTLGQVSAADGDAYYLCQGAISTRTGYNGGAKLRVLVPPRIVEHQTSSSLVQASEFEPLSLKCTVSGEPQSQVHWKRESSGKLDSLDQIITREGHLDVAQLNFSSFRRDQAGVYLCIASNGVQPGVSQRVSLLATKCRSGNLTAPEEPCERPASQLGRPSWFASGRAQAANRQQQARAGAERRRLNVAGERRSAAADAGQVSIKQASSAGHPLIGWPSLFHWSASIITGATFITRLLVGQHCDSM